jgi:hypothetical protein
MSAEEATAGTLGADVAQYDTKPWKLRHAWTSTWTFIECYSRGGVLEKTTYWHRRILDTTFRVGRQNPPYNAYALFRPNKKMWADIVDIVLFLCVCALGVSMCGKTRSSMNRMRFLSTKRTCEQTWHTWAFPKCNVCGKNWSRWPWWFKSCCAIS